MNKFDLAAEKYDEQFTNSVIGIEQRKQVWRRIENYDISVENTVLEVNCGTGEDANYWFCKGHNILSTDISLNMLEVAKHKFPRIEFQQLDLRNVQNQTSNYDLIFSNFGGLNCLSPFELKQFLLDSNSILNANGKLILVIMGKKCLWDKLFLILKGKWRQRNRRNTNEESSVNVDGENVNTWYYSPKEIDNFVENNFKVLDKHPIGFFVPPSYLASFLKKRKRFLKLLVLKDKFLSFSFLSNYADHYIIYLEKKDLTNASK